MNHRPTRPLRLAIASVVACLLCPRPGHAAFEHSVAKYTNAIPPNSNGASTAGRIPLGTGTRGDITHVRYPTVVKDGDTYRMWYIGYEAPIYCAYHATSPDGLTWTKYNNVQPADSNTTGTDGRITVGATLGDDARILGLSVIEDAGVFAAGGPVAFRRKSDVDASFADC